VTDAPLLFFFHSTGSFQVDDNIQHIPDMTETTVMSNTHETLCHILLHSSSRIWQKSSINFSHF